MAKKVVVNNDKRPVKSFGVESGVNKPSASFLKRFPVLKNFTAEREKYLKDVSDGVKSIKDIPLCARSEDLLKAAIKKDWRAFEKIRDAHQLTYDLCVTLIENWHSCLEDVPKHFRTLELCLKAVKGDGLELEEVPEGLRTMEIVEAALSNDGRALQFVNADLRSRQLCLLAVKNNYKALACVPYPYQDDDEILIAAINQDSRAISLCVDQNDISENVYCEMVKKYGNLNDIPDEKKTEAVLFAAVDAINDHGTEDNLKGLNPNLFTGKVIEKILLTNNRDLVNHIPYDRLISFIENNS